MKWADEPEVNEEDYIEWEEMGFSSLREAIAYLNEQCIKYKEDECYLN
jgi:hypothetical protein